MDKQSVHTQSELKESVRYLRLTLPKMRSLGIPFTPKNYAVWYEYISGKTPQLNKAIDNLIETNAIFDNEANEDLFNNYVKEQILSQVIGGIRNETENILIRLLSELRIMQEGTDQFSNSLTESANTLESDVHADVLSQLIGNLLSEIDEVKNNNSSMENTLKSMTDEVVGLRVEMGKIHSASMSDSLTGIMNRGAFDTAITELIETSADGQTTFSLLFLDIDHFKKFNDTYGHISGDRVLQYVAAATKRGIKGKDMVARYGGEEFAVLLPDTPYKGAMAVAQSLCDRIGSKTLTKGETNKQTLGKITVSVGVSQFIPEDSQSSLVGRADKALYMAKDGGRNQVKGINIQ